MHRGILKLLDTNVHHDKTVCKWRDLAHKIASDSEASFLILELGCPKPVLQEWLKTRAHSNNEISDGRIELLQIQEEHYQPPTEFNPRQRIKIDTSLPFEDSVTCALRNIFGLLMSPTESNPGGMGSGKK